METLEAVGAIAGVIVAVCAVIGLLAGLWVFSRRLADVHDLVLLHLRPRVDRQLENPADMRVGMIDRVDAMDERVERIDATVTRELHPNGSHSMHDRVRVVEGYVQELREREHRGSSGRRVREPHPAPVNEEPLDASR